MDREDEEDDEAEDIKSRRSVAQDKRTMSYASVKDKLQRRKELLGLAKARQKDIRASSNLFEAAMQNKLRTEAKTTTGEPIKKKT